MPTHIEQRGDCSRTSSAFSISGFRTGPVLSVVLRSFAGVTAALLITVLGACGPRDTVHVELPVAPDINVLVISFDAFRQDSLKAYGNTLNLAPNMDAFADESTVFLNAYTAGQATPSSFAAAFTGMFPHRVFRGWNLSETQTLAKVFAAAGYTTGANLNNQHLIEDRNFRQGFEFYTTDPGRSDEKVAREFGEFLETHKDEKFFAWVHFINPHSPYTRRPEAEHLLTPGYEGDYLESSGARVQVLEPREMREQDLKRIQELYNGEIFFTDRLFKQVMDKVRELGLLDKTVIVLTADHGEAMVEHDAIGHANLYEEVIRIPLVVRHPGVAKAARIDARVSNIDLLPSLASIAGLGYASEPINGISWLDGIPRNRPLLSTQMTNPGKYSMTMLSSDFKTISWCTKNNDFREELYNLADDPGEIHDLIASPDHADQINELFRLKTQVASGEPCSVIAGAIAGGSMTDVDDETLQALRSLGYIQ
jgi:arylsulfatase